MTRTFGEAFSSRSSIPTDSHTVLAVRDISRRFEKTQALDRVSFHLRRGEVFALLGPNGAGKTTMAHLLQGEFPPDSGEILFYRGEDVKPRLDAAEMGYFPGDSSIYKSLPIHRVLYHAGVRRGMSAEGAQQAADKWLARLELTARATTALGNLSRGNQQKVQFAEAVIHSPDIVFLDEPFANLDPVNQELFVALIRELQAQGMTILLSDHQMALVERLANRIAILNEGRIIAQGALNELRTQARAGLRVRLRLADPNAISDLGDLYSNPVVRLVERTASGEVRIMTSDDTLPIEILNFAKTRLRISEILAEPASLHDVYLHFLTNAGNRPPMQEAS